MGVTGVFVAILYLLYLLDEKRPPRGKAIAWGVLIGIAILVLLLVLTPRPPQDATGQPHLQYSRDRMR